MGMNLNWDPSRTSFTCGFVSRLPVLTALQVCIIHLIASKSGTFEMRGVLASLLAANPKKGFHNKSTTHMCLALIRFHPPNSDHDAEEGREGELGLVPELWAGNQQNSIQNRGYAREASRRITYPVGPLE